MNYDALAGRSNPYTVFCRYSCPGAKTVCRCHLGMLQAFGNRWASRATPEYALNRSTSMYLPVYNWKPGSVVHICILMPVAGLASSPANWHLLAPSIPKLQPSPAWSSTKLQSYKSALPSSMPSPNRLAVRKSIDGFRSRCKWLPVGTNCWFNSSTDDWFGTWRMWLRTSAPLWTPFKLK